MLSERMEASPKRCSQQCEARPKGRARAQTWSASPQACEQPMNQRDSRQAEGLAKTPLRCPVLRTVCQVTLPGEGPPALDHSWWSPVKAALSRKSCRWPVWASHSLAWTPSSPEPPPFPLVPGSRWHISSPCGAETSPVSPPPGPACNPRSHSSLAPGAVSSRDLPFRPAQR